MEPPTSVVFFFSFGDPEGKPHAVRTRRARPRGPRPAKGVKRITETALVFSPFALVSGALPEGQ